MLPACGLVPEQMTRENHGLVRVIKMMFRMVQVSVPLQGNWLIDPLLARHFCLFQYPQTGLSIAGGNQFAQPWIHLYLCYPCPKQLCTIINPATTGGLFWLKEHREQPQDPRETKLGFAQGFFPKYGKWLLYYTTDFLTDS